VRHMRAQKRAYVVALSTAALVILVACSSANKKDQTSPSSAAGSTTSAVSDAASAGIKAQDGGLVRGPAGSELFIPPGVLSKDGTASITTFQNGTIDFHIGVPWTGQVQVRVAATADEAAEGMLGHQVQGEWGIEESNYNEGRLVAWVKSLSLIKMVKCFRKGLPDSIKKCLIKEGIKSIPSRIAKKVGFAVDGCGDVLDLESWIGDGGCKAGDPPPELWPSSRPKSPQTATGAPRPTLSNFAVTVKGPGTVSISFSVGWKDGRGPVACHFLADGKEVFAAQCGTRASKQVAGLMPGTHIFEAFVTDRDGLASERSPQVMRLVPGSPPAEPEPPAPGPKPSATNLVVVSYGGGHVGVAFEVGWQSGRDPVTCHFFIDGAEAFTAQCGTHSSKQFYGIAAGQHSFCASVSDRYGIFSDPTSIVYRDVS
jgi:hypothetical protein